MVNYTSNWIIVFFLFVNSLSFAFVYKSCLIQQNLATFAVKKFFHNFIHNVDNRKFPNSNDVFKYDSIDPSIMFWDNALSCDECNLIIKEFETSKLLQYQGSVHIDGKIADNPSIKKNTEISISSETSVFKWYKLEQLLTTAVIKHLNLYQDANIILQSHQNPFGDEGFRIKRYTNDGTEHHSYHSDTGHEATNSVAPRRILAAIFYLNDVSEGGETVFINQNISIKPVAGRLVLFPTSFTFVHAGIILCVCE